MYKIPVYYINHKATENDDEHTEDKILGYKKEKNNTI